MELRFEQIVPAALNDVFAFHAHPDNLARLLCRWPRFRLLRHDGPVRAGGRMWIEERFCWLPIAMAFEHHVYEPPRRIGGRLVHGPFLRFEHVHEFDALSQGTRVRDTLQIEVPWEYGGDWMLRRFIAPLLARAFIARQRELARLAQEQLLGPAAACV